MDGGWDKAGLWLVCCYDVELAVRAFSFLPWLDITKKDYGMLIKLKQLNRYIHEPLTGLESEYSQFAYMHLSNQVTLGFLS